MVRKNAMERLLSPRGLLGLTWVKGWGRTVEEKFSRQGSPSGENRNTQENTFSRRTEHYGPRKREL